MLIGNRDRFAIELVPVSPSWEPRYEPEAAAWAGLGIWVRGKNLCAHVRAGEEELRTSLFVPLGPIADWLVRAYPGLAFEERPRWFETTRRLHDVVRKWGESPPPVGVDEDAWLDDREAFWSRHFLLAGAEGAWLPNLCLLREDDDVIVAWREPPAHSVDPITFLNAEGSVRVAWQDVHAVLSRFVDEVALAFEQRKLAPYAWLAAVPSRLHVAVSGPEIIALYCARSLQQVAELLDVREGDVSDVLGAEAVVDPATNPLCQVFRDLPPGPSEGVGGEARVTLDHSTKATRSSALALWKTARALALDAARPAETAERAGQLAAAAVRRALALDDQPIDTRDALDRSGVVARTSAVEANHEHMLVVAARRCAPAVTILQTVQTRKRWGNRFEEARALGHALLDPLRGDALGAASTKWTPSVRRRRSGAFAAELLLPKRVLDISSGGHLDGVGQGQAFTDLIERYGVGATTAAWQLYNHKLVSLPVRDELIELYAGRGD
ncbi:MAG TPA: hypothetical protein VH165_02530 [Kofleriaceae bacterium]|jgi:hypothetical protein|nr:hypothetical protein [Kofleriaceae bacterium]